MARVYLFLYTQRKYIVIYKYKVKCCMHGSIGGWEGSWPPPPRKTRPKKSPLPNTKSILNLDPPPENILDERLEFVHIHKYFIFLILYTQCQRIVYFTET